MTRKGFTLIELMIVIAILAIIAAIAIPALMSSVSASNQRSASGSLKAIAAGEFDFRSNDRDGNGIQDFWTGDLAGLYSMTSARTAGNMDDPVKTIDVGVAASDSNPLPGGSAGGEYRAITDFYPSSHKSGYWITVLDTDLGSAGVDYQQDTGGSIPMGAVHNMNRFGFIAYPDAHLQSGRAALIVNESVTVFKADPPNDIRPSPAVPPGAMVDPGFKDWPDDAGLAANWGKLD